MHCIWSQSPWHISFYSNVLDIIILFPIQYQINFTAKFIVRFSFWMSIEWSKKIIEIHGKLKYSFSETVYLNIPMYQELMINNILTMSTRLCCVFWFKLFFSIYEHKHYFTHFKPMLYFYAPWKCQKIRCFLTFSEGIKIEHWL